MVDRFTEIIEELSKIINLNLVIEKGDKCSLLINKKLPIELKFIASSNSLLIVSTIAEVEPGKYREKVFTKALIANNQLNRAGILSYQESHNSIVLFQFLPTNLVTSEVLKSHLHQFIKMGLQWQEAILHNNFSFIEETRDNLSEKIPFNLRP